MIFTGEIHFADTVSFQQTRFIQFVFENGFAEKIILIGAVTVHVPVIVAINVGQNIRIVMHDAEQVSGDVFIQIVRENQVTVGVMHARTVGGDHVRTDFQIVAHLRYIDMVTPGGEHEMHVALGQQFQRLFGERAQGMIR